MFHVIIDGECFLEVLIQNLMNLHNDLSRRSINEPNSFQYPMSKIIVENIVEIVNDTKEETSFGMEFFSENFSELISI